MMAWRVMWGWSPQDSFSGFVQVLHVLRKMSWQAIWSFLVPLINGILIFWERLTIERWISLPCSSIYCIPSDWDGVVKTRFVGFLPKEGYLNSHATMSLFPMIVLLSLMRSIWRNKVSLIVAFLAWSNTFGKILTMDNLKKRRVIV